MSNFLAHYRRGTATKQMARPHPRGPDQVPSTAPGAPPAQATHELVR